MSLDSLEPISLGECHKINNFFNQYAFITNAEIIKSKELTGIVNECQSVLNGFIKAMLQISDLHISDEETLEKFMNLNNLPEDWRQRGLLVYRKRREYLNYYKEGKYIFEVIKNWEKISVKSKSEKLVLAKDLANIVSLGKDLDPLFETILNFAQAILVENTAWLKNLGRDFVQSGPYLGLFSPMNGQYKTDEIKSVVQFLLKKSKELLKDDTLLKAMAKKWDGVFGLNEPFFAKEFSADWSLTTIREHLFSVKNGRKLAGFWLQELFPRTTEKEIARFFRNVVDQSFVKKMKDEQVWIFQYYFPVDSRIRKIIIDRMAHIMANGSLYSQFQVMRLLEDDIIRKNYFLRFPEKRKVLFVLKRDYFRRLLDSGQARDLSHFNLMKMGERDIKHFWWYVL